MKLHLLEDLEPEIFCTAIAGKLIGRVGLRIDGRFFTGHIENNLHRTRVPFHKNQLLEKKDTLLPQSILVALAIHYFLERKVKIGIFRVLISPALLPNHLEAQARHPLSLH